MKKRKSQRKVSESSSHNSVLKIDQFSILPPEIRNRIYELVLGPPYDLSICQTYLKPESATGFSSGWQGRMYIRAFIPSLLSLLRVSKQIYSETFHIFYSMNQLTFSDTYNLLQFLRGVGYNRRQHITMINFYWSGCYAKEAFRLLKTCQRLRSLWFTVPCDMPPGYAALREVRGLDDVYPIGVASPGYHGFDIFYRGDYQYHGRRNGGPMSYLSELEDAMRRPRLKQYELDSTEAFDLMKARREKIKKTEVQRLLEDTASYRGRY